MTIEETRELLATIVDWFPNTRFSPTADTSWHAELEPYPAAAVVAVARKISKENGGFAPDVFRIVDELEQILSPEPSADELWT